jgi:hypothetical protein
LDPVDTKAVEEEQTIEMMETAGGTDIRESEPQREDNCFCY